VPGVLSEEDVCEEVPLREEAGRQGPQAVPREPEGLQLSQILQQLLGELLQEVVREVQVLECLQPCKCLLGQRPQPVPSQVQVLQPWHSTESPWGQRVQVVVGHGQAGELGQALQRRQGPQRVAGEDQLPQGRQLWPGVQSHQLVVSQVEVLQLGEGQEGGGGEGCQAVGVEQQDARVGGQVRGHRAESLP